MNFYGTAAGPQHTLFGRLVPMMEAMRLAISRAAEQPLPAVQFSHALPEWMHHIADELTCTVFKGVINLAPVGQKYHARRSGQMMGLLIRAGLFYWKQVPAILEREGLTKLTPERKARIEKFTGWDVACDQASKLAGHPITTKAQVIKFLLQRVNRFVVRTVNVMWTLTKYALNQPVEDVLEFFCGIPEGFKCFLRTDGELAKNGGRVEIFLAMLTYWPEIEEMRRAQPPLPKPYVLAWLEKQEGKQLMPSDHAFSELCNDIECDFGLTGHPFNRPD